MKFLEIIETIDQLEFIRSIGAHYYQGYLHSKPMSYKALVKHLQEGFKFFYKELDTQYLTLFFVDFARNISNQIRDYVL